MSLEKKREEIGGLIACLLVSRKESCGIKELEKDFCECEGKSIPFREFGCHSTIDFLRSIPKYVTLSGRNGDYMVHPVVSKKIQHVNDLVIRQRRSKKTTPGRRRQSRPSRYFPSVFEPKPFIENSVQKQIAHMLVENPSGVEASSIVQCLENSNKIARPVDLSNVNDYIGGVPHIAVANGSHIYPSKSLTATTDAKQKTNSHTPITAEVFSNIPDASSRINNVAYPGGSEEGGEFYDEDFYDEFADEDFAVERSVVNNCTNDKNRRSQNGNRPKLSSAEFISRVSNWEQHQEQLSNNTFENGYVIENRDTKVNANHAGNFVSNSEREYVSLSEDETVNIIGERLRSRLEKLIKKHPNGIWCANLLEIFLAEYKVPLDYIELGFGSVCELAANLRKIFYLHRWDDRGDFILYDASQPLPAAPEESKSLCASPVWQDEFDGNDDIEPFPMTFALQASEKLIPNDVMTQNESVGQERIPEITADEDCIEVYVADVYTPSLFWIHLRRKRVKLHYLMETMHEFYQQEGDKYTIPHVILEKGLNCVCLFEDRWHRAIIKTVKPDGDVTLIFYDFGTTKTYSPDRVRFLHRRFSNLPAQSIACGLYNVKPFNSDVWSRGASSEFWDKVRDLPLMAIVIKIDRDNNSMLVSLVDTQYKEDFHMNDWMVHKKLAKYGCMVRSRPSNFVFKHYIACANHHYKKVMKNLKKVEDSRQVDRPESQNSSSSKGKLKSGDYLKNLMSKHSKYKKECDQSVSSEMKSTSYRVRVAREQISTQVSGCSSKNLPELAKVGQFSETINGNRFLNVLRNLPHGSMSPNKNIETIQNQTQFSSPCGQQEDEKIVRNDESSSSSSSNLVEKSTKLIDTKKPDDASKIINEDFVEGEVRSGRLEYSGTFRSFFGGHSHLNPIDWSKLREDAQLKCERVNANAEAEPRAVEASSSFNLSRENTRKVEPPRYSQGCSIERSKESSYPGKIPDLREVIVTPSVVKSITKKLLPAKDCFLNEVRCNKDNYYSVHGKKLWWSPEGNIQSRPGVITPLLRTRRKCIKESGIDSMKVYVSPEISQILRGENLQNKMADPELDFIINLKRQDEIPEKSQNRNISNKSSSNVFSSSQSLAANPLSESRFATILNYMNRKKDPNVALFSKSNSSSVQDSSTSVEPESAETPDTVSSNLILSDSSLSSNKIFNTKKDQVGVKTKEFLDKHDTINTDERISSENIDAVVVSDKLSEHPSSPAVSDVDNIPDKRDANPEKQDRISLLNITPVEFISRKISSSDHTDHDEASTQQFSNLRDFGNDESSKIQEDVLNYASPCLLQSTISNPESDNISELDSDDLSQPHSASEAGVISSAECQLLDVTEASIVLQGSSLDESKNSRENLTLSNESVSSVDNEKIETCGAKILPKNVPVFDDLESMSDSDEWDVNGEWIDFVKGEFVDKLETTDGASKLAICDQDNDESEVDDIENISDFGNKQTNEEIDDNKFIEICDTIGSKNIEFDLKLESTIESPDCEQVPDSSISSSENCWKDSGEPSTEYLSMQPQIEKIKDKTSLSDIATNKNLTPSNEDISSKVSTVGLEAEGNSVSSEKINDLDNGARMYIENQSHEAAMSSKKDLPVAITSKTKSMHDMLRNFKLKVKLKSLNNHKVNEVDGNLKSDRNVLQFKGNLKSEKTSFIDNEKSGDLQTKESFSKSELFADLSSTSSSSRCSLNAISSDTIGSGSQSEITRYITAHKNYSSLPQKYNTPINPSKIFSSDNVESVEEQPETPSKQLPISILAIVKKKQLSTKSPSPNSQVNLDMSRRDDILFNTSSLSSSGSYTPLFDKETVTTDTPLYQEDLEIPAKDVAAELENVPLIRPHSTMVETPKDTLKPPPGFTQRSEPGNVAAFMDAFADGTGYNATELGGSTYMNFCNINMKNNPLSSQNATFSPLIFPTEAIVQFVKNQLEIELQKQIDDKVAEAYKKLASASLNPSIVNGTTLNNSNTDPSTSYTNPIPQERNPFQQEFATTSNNFEAANEFSMNQNSSKNPFSSTASPLPNVDFTVSNGSLFNLEKLSNELYLLPDSRPECNGSSENALLGEAQFVKDLKNTNNIFNSTMNNEEFANQQFHCTNPFKMYAAKNFTDNVEPQKEQSFKIKVENNNSNNKPPIPPRNPNLINKSLNLTPRDATTHVKPAELPTVQDEIPATKLYYEAKPVMYNIGKTNDSQTNSKPDEQIPKSKDTDQQSCGNLNREPANSSSRRKPVSETSKPNIIHTAQSIKQEFIEQEDSLHEEHHRSHNPNSSTLRSSEKTGNFIYTFKPVTDTKTPIAIHFNEGFELDKKQNDTSNLQSSYSSKVSVNKQNPLEQIHQSPGVTFARDNTMENKNSELFDAKAKSMPANAVPPHYNHPHLKNTTQHYTPLYTPGPMQCGPNYPYNYAPHIAQYPGTNPRPSNLRPSAAEYYPSPPSGWPGTPFYNPGYAYQYPRAPYPYRHSQVWSQHNLRMFAQKTSNLAQTLPQENKANINTSRHDQMPNNLPEFIHHNAEPLTTFASDAPLSHNTPQGLTNVHSFDTPNFKECNLSTQPLRTRSASPVQNTVKSEENSKNQTSSTQQCSNSATLPMVVEKNKNVEESLDQNLNSLPRSISSPPTPKLFKPISANNQTIYLFNICNQGWVCTDEITQTFTKYPSRTVVLGILEQVGEQIDFMAVDRTQSPTLFSQLDNSNLRLPRMPSTKKIRGLLHLTPVKSLARLMVALRVIPNDEFNSLREGKVPPPGSILPELVTIITSYKADDEYWVS